MFVHSKNPRTSTGKKKCSFICQWSCFSVNVSSSKRILCISPECDLIHEFNMLGNGSKVILNFVELLVHIIHDFTMRSTRKEGLLTWVAWALMFISTLSCPYQPSSHHTKILATSTHHTKILATKTILWVRTPQQLLVSYYIHVWYYIKHLLDIALLLGHSVEFLGRSTW